MAKFDFFLEWGGGEEYSCSGRKNV